MPKSKMEVVLDCVDPQGLAPFWSAALGYRILISLPEIVVLVPEEGTDTPLLLQRVPEAKTVKNRMHLDIVAPDVDSQASHLETLGARRSHEGLRRLGPTTWLVMADPDGNEFCVSTGVEW